MSDSDISAMVKINVGSGILSYMKNYELAGILNVTPDSFSDGREDLRLTTVLNEFWQLDADGAYIVDIGAESTRPGATPLSWEQEFERLHPLVLNLRYGAGMDFIPKLSFDTRHPETVTAISRHLGNNFILNDVTGLHSPVMQNQAISLGLDVVVSHLPQGANGDIQSAHYSKKIDSVDQVTTELQTNVDRLTTLGLEKDRIILDPGIGFGKTSECNFELLDFAAEVPEHRVMIGYSRKRFLGPERMSAAVNIAAGKRAIDSGAKYLRVHDVKAHRDHLPLNQ